MAQIIPFPFHKIKNKNNHFTEKHILHMIKNIRENYPPSLWNTIYQLSKKGHLNEYSSTFFCLDLPKIFSNNDTIS